MNVFVTGGSGFLGRNLIRALVDRGDRVRALARSDRSCAAVEGADAEAVRGDLADEAALRAGVEGCEGVIHSAAKVEPWGRLEDFQAINVEGTRRLLEVSREGGVRRFVHVGTEAAFATGGPMSGLDHETPLPDDPLPGYPRTKNAAERLVRAASDEQLTAVVVRPRLIWGAGDTSVLPLILERVRDGRFMWVAGGRYRTSTCHVRNVCEGILLALERGRPGAAYFLTDGEPIEFREFLTRLLATQGVEPGTRSVPRWLAWGLAGVLEPLWRLLGIQSEPPVHRVPLALTCQEVTVSDALARDELGYEGRVSLAEGLREMEREPAT